MFATASPQRFKAITIYICIQSSKILNPCQKLYLSYLKLLAESFKLFFIIILPFQQPQLAAQLFSKGQQRLKLKWCQILAPQSYNYIQQCHLNLQPNLHRSFHQKTPFGTNFFSFFFEELFPLLYTTHSLWLVGPTMKLPIL